jgi:hypothetical protein
MSRRDWGSFAAFAGIGDRQVTGSPACCRAGVLRELRVCRDCRCSLNVIEGQVWASCGYWRVTASELFNLVCRVVTRPSVIVRVRPKAGVANRDLPTP